MASTSHATQYKALKPLRIVRVRWRLFLAVVVGLFAFILLPGTERLISRALVGWDVCVAVYLALCLSTASYSDLEHIRSHSVLYDEGRFAIPILTVTAALASLGCGIQYRTNRSSLP